MIKFKKLVVLFIVSQGILQVSGLRCWRCENAASPKECIKTGYLKQCRYREKSCQTEVRLSQKKYLIKTDCKESEACTNNKQQNQRGWQPTQCNNNVRNSVCRCCCQTRNCNRRNLLCKASRNPKKPIDEDAKKDFPKPSTLKSEPTCAKLPSTPKSGYRTCIGFGEVGTNCTFTCNPGYKLQGSSSTLCTERRKRPSWTHKTPECVQQYCPDLGDLRQGEISCNEVDLRLGTICQFSCLVEGYELMPSERTRTECVGVGAKAKWSHRKPCCGTSCPPKARKDVIIIMDSSSSINKKEWYRMKKFVADVTANFDVSNDGVHFAIYRFTRNVDVEHEVHFEDYINNGSSLREAVMNFPKNGGGTFIGRALRHARDSVLTNGNREDVADLIWVLTDGRSDDDTEEISRELREAGVEIMALGITHQGKNLSKEDLLKIAGEEDNILYVTDGMKSLTDHLVSRIVGKFCESSCHDEL